MNLIIQITSYLAFFIITILGIAYLFRDESFVTSPFDSKKIFRITGIQQFFLFTLSIGILQLGELSAARLLIWIIFVLIAIIMDRSSIVISTTGWIYVVFLCWLVISIFYSPAKMFGVRNLMKYLYPFLILLLASKITVRPILFVKSLKIILKVGLWGALFILVLVRIPFISELSNQLFWYYTAILDAMTVIVIVSLVLFAYTKEWKYLLCTLLFISLSIVTVNRTGLLSVSVSIIIYSIIRYKIKAVPYIILASTIFIGSVLLVPGFKEKMFKQKSLTTEQIIEKGDALSSEDIDSNGRFAMWEWSLKRFYEGKKLTGSGLGVLQDVFYSKKHPFGSIRIVHNDYVQLLCDTGIIGLALYLSIFLSLFIHSLVVFFDKRHIQPTRICAVTAGSSLMGMAVTLYFDNAVNYSLMTLCYPFAIYGMLLGLLQYEKLRKGVNKNVIQ